MSKTRTHKAFRNPVQREAEARALTDPRPTFVSLVKAGANQTPLRVIKAQVISCKEHREMTEAIQRARSNGFEIQQIQFRKSEGGQFSGDQPIDAVRAWLEQGGYMVDAIEEDDEHFSVKNDETEFEEGTTQQIELDDVVVTVARVKGAEAPQVSEEDRQREHAGRTGSAIIHKEVRAKDTGEGAREATEEDPESEKSSDKGKDKRRRARRGMRFDDGAHELLTKADCQKRNLPEGSRYATKFEQVEGVCGQGFVSVTVDGALICVPMGNTEGFIMEDQPSPAAASGGQGSAGFGGTAPAHPGGQSGQESNTGEKPAATASVGSPAEGQGNAGAGGATPAHGSDGGGGNAPVAPAGGNAPSGGESGGGSSFAGSQPAHATRTRTRTRQATPSAFGEQNEAEIDEAYHGDPEAYDRETDKPGRNVPSTAQAPGAPVPSPLDPNTAERVRSGKVITFKGAHPDGATKAEKDAVWNATKELASADVDDLAVISAWRADKEEVSREDFDFSHHQVAKGYPVVFRALTEGIDRLNGEGWSGRPIAESDRQGVYRHLSRHVREDFGEEPAKLASRENYLATLKTSNENAERAQRLKGTLAARFVGDSEIFRDQPEARQKFDEFMAMFSDGRSLAEVMDDASDGMPPGLMEVIIAMITAVRNNILAGDIDGVRAVAVEFGEITAALTSLFGVDENAQRALEHIMPSQPNPWQAVAPTAEETEQTEQETHATRGGEETSPEQARDDEALTGVLRDLTASVKQGLSDLQDEVHAVRDDLDERVTELETSRRHTRRSADDVEVGQPVTPAQKDPLREIRMRGALGITSGTNGYDR